VYRGRILLLCSGSKARFSGFGCPILDAFSRVGIFFVVEIHIGFLKPEA
jgi:hypothetical protein